MVSSILSRLHSGQKTIAEWAEQQITAESLDALAHGALVIEHEGSTDAPWSVSYEFTVDGTRFAWELASLSGGHVIRPVGERAPFSPAGNYEPVWNALVGPAGDDHNGSDLPPLPEFSLGLLCRLDWKPVETPQVQPPGGSFSPDLEPHRRFAELAGIPAWTLPSNRVYSLAWVLRLVFQRGLLMIGEQFRGVATLAAPLRMIGRFTVSELAGSAPSFEPYALPLRLLRLKNGGLAEQARFRRVQEVFRKLAPGRSVDLSFSVEQLEPVPPQSGVADHRSEAEVMITVLVRHRDPSAGGEWELPIQLSGAGTWEALVVAEALTDPAGRVVILDEPATVMHPGWQQLLKGQLRERAGDGQFVVITHSPYLVPMETEDDLYRLIRIAPRDGATRLARAPRPLDDARVVMRDYSMSADARALLFASGAVLLEGETEHGALPVWFAKSQAAQELGDPESLHLRFYNVGGDTHFKAPLTLLAALRIPWAVLCGGWLFDPQFRGNHIFRQVARAGAADAGIQSFVQTYIDDPTMAGTVTFEQSAGEAAKHGIFTLAKGWTRDDRKNGVSGNESFEFFIDQVLPGELVKAEGEIGRSKSLRKGRWLADNNPCPPEIEELYRDIVAALTAKGMPSLGA